MNTGCKSENANNTAPHVSASDIIAQGSDSPSEAVKPLLHYPTISVEFVGSLAKEIEQRHIGCGIRGERNITATHVSACRICDPLISSGASCGILVVLICVLVRDNQIVVV